MHHPRIQALVEGVVAVHQRTQASQGEEGAVDLQSSSLVAQAGEVGVEGPQNQAWEEAWRL